MPKTKCWKRSLHCRKAGASSAEKRRRKIGDNIEATSTTPASDNVNINMSLSVAEPCGSSSRKKINLMAANQPEIVPETDQMWCIVNIQCINQLIASSLCQTCHEPGMTIKVVAGENAGFATKLCLTCNNPECQQTEFVMSSPRLHGSDKQNVGFVINTKMALFSHEVGGSYAAVKKFAAVLGMPPMALKTFQSHDSKIAACEQQRGGDVLAASAKVVRQAYADTDHELQEAMDRGEEPVVEVAVSFDGTWMKRGFTSLYGVGIAIDILTGLVVDYQVMSKYCHACELKEKEQLPTDQLAAWQDSHRDQCCINHTASSKAMEQEAAKVIWRRSLAKNKMKYTEMLSDGDSSSFKAVCTDPAIQYEVKTLECLNHASKRMGTALRKLAKDEKLGGKGTGKLTAGKCDTLQKYYYGAIKTHANNPEQLKNEIWATLWHSMSTDEEPRHHLCPKGASSWCFYQQALARGETSPSHRDHRTSTFLSKPVAHKMIPVYRRMADEQLLERLTLGGTQNTNECLNALIWSRCPKTTFMGMQRVEGSVARAVANFNEGARELLAVMDNLCLDISLATVTILTKKDANRMERADTAARNQVRLQRKANVVQRRCTVREEEAEEGPMYEAGSF